MMEEATQIEKEKKNIKRKIGTETRERRQRDNSVACRVLRFFFSFM